MSKKEKSDVDLDAMRHSCSHVLAQAVLDMFPEAKLGIGPTIENGFYYDFDLPRTLIPEDLPILEKKMKHIIKQNQQFVHYETPSEETINFLQDGGQPYKVELAKELKERGEETISFYENKLPNGEATFVDMCAGPHVESTSKIKAFKLTKIAGAYWRGDEKNKMLQRIYGVCFANQEELDNHLKCLEEAKKRDHRKLGKELDLFSFHDEGVGFPFFHPKGMVLWKALEDYWYEVHSKYNYKMVKTPIILNEDLWKQSGHYDHYRENMYFTNIDEVPHAVKPMNCPGSILIYKSNAYSYRDFPFRWGEMGLVHRHEMSGVLCGLFRVRSFTQDDAHIYCTPDQVKDLLRETIKLFEEVYNKFGFDYHIELSTRPEKSTGSDELWELAETTMKEVLEEDNIDHQVNEGDGAFYGPKFDFHLKDCLGRTWQCGTLQLDFAMPDRFDLEYTDADGTAKRPVMLHRVVYGSFERFYGILIEHFAGAFPAWLAPVQVAIIPVAEPHADYANLLQQKFEESGLRVEIYEPTETLGKRIRATEMQKIPYMLVVGDKETETDEINVRNYKTKEQKTFKVDEFLKTIKSEIAARTI